MTSENALNSKIQLLTDTQAVIKTQLILKARKKLVYGAWPQSMSELFVWHINILIKNTSHDINERRLFTHFIICFEERCLQAVPRIYVFNKRTNGYHQIKLPKTPSVDKIKIEEYCNNFFSDQKHSRSLLSKAKALSLKSMEFTKNAIFNTAKTMNENNQGWSLINTLNYCIWLVITDQLAVTCYKDAYSIVNYNLNTEPSRNYTDNHVLIKAEDPAGDRSACLLHSAAHIGNLTIMTPLTISADDELSNVDIDLPEASDDISMECNELGDLTTAFIKEDFCCDNVRCDVCSSQSVQYSNNLFSFCSGFFFIDRERTSRLTSKDSNNCEVSSLESQIQLRTPKKTKDIIYVHGIQFSDLKWYYFFVFIPMILFVDIYKFLKKMSDLKYAISVFAAVFMFTVIFLFVKEVRNNMQTVNRSLIGEAEVSDLVAQIALKILN